MSTRRHGWRREVLGVRRSAAGEILVFFAAALLIDALLLDGTRFIELRPHPFWLLVILVSAHYGTAEGVLASVLGAFLAFVGNLPPRDPLQDQSVYLVSVLARPALWFASAVVLGELRTRQGRKHAALKEQVRQLSSEREHLQAANDTLQAANERLRAQAAGQVRSTASLVEAGRTLDTREPASVFAGAERLITSLLEPTAWSIYLLDDSGLELVVHTTDGRTPQARKLYPRGSTLFEAVMVERRVVHVADPDGQRVLDDEGVIAGPLMDMKADEPLGMLKVEALPLANLQQDTVAAFGSLCEWIGNAYRAAQDFEAANRAAVFHRGSQLFTEAYYEPVSAFLVALAERARFPVTQLTVRVQAAQNGGSSDPEAISQTVQRAVEAGLRTTDLAFDLQHARGEYVVVLPMTPIDRGQLVSDRLRRAVEVGLADAHQAAHVSVTFEALYVPTADDLKPWHRAVIRCTDPYST